MNILMVELSLFLTKLVENVNRYLKKKKKKRRVDIH